MLKLVINSWYVINIRWVKNVNKLRKQGCVSCVNLSTKNYHNQNKPIPSCVELILNNPHLLHYSTTKNTPKLLKSNLLDKTFTHFPHHLLINSIKEI
jgi:hypothetical protein